MLNRSSRVFVTVVTSLWVAMPALGAGNGSDELWEVTTKMEMAGMPMAMPAQTNRQCLPKGSKQEEKMVPMDSGDCKTLDFKQTGNKTTFSMKCAGKDPMTGTGEFTHTGDGYHGTMHITGTSDGEPIDMTQTFSGKRVGNCTYEDVGKKMVAQQNAAMAEQCREYARSLYWRAFDGDSPCKDHKGELCEQVRNVSADPARFTEELERSGEWREMLGFCGENADKMMAAACKRATDERNWQFVANRCEKEAEALAMQHCAGRDYTAAMNSEYAAICRTYAKTRFGTGSGAAASGQQDGDGGASNSDTPTDVLIEQGANQLKKLIGW